MDDTFDATPDVPWGGMQGLAPARRRVSWGSDEPSPMPAGDAAPAPAPRRRGTVPTADESAAAGAVGMAGQDVAATFPAPVADAAGADLAAVFAAEAPPGDLGALFAGEVPDTSEAVAAGGGADAGLEGLFSDPAPVPGDRVHSSALADIFDDSPAATTSGSGLGDLFADSPATAQPVPDTGLGGLFDDTDDPAATIAPATDNPDEQAAAAFGGPVFSGREQVRSATDEPAQQSTEATPQPAAQPHRFDLASRRAALAAARADQVTVASPSAADEQAQRFAQLEYYYHYVERILGLGRGGDPELQAFIKGLELTRDKDLDADQRRRYEQFMVPRLAAAQIQIPNASDLTTIFDLAYDELIGIGPLGPLWRDDDVTEIKLMCWDRVVVERNGQLQPTAVRFRSAEHAETTARQLAQKVDDRALSPTNPLPTAQLPGARVQFVYRPLVKSRLSVTIRKFRPMLDMSTLLAYGSLSEEMAAFLCDAVRARATVLVSGGTGSGKTTFVNALSEFIPDTELVITIEDALELQLRNTYVESLLTKEAASADDRVLFGQDELLKATLRMRPDRVIVGEIRDGRGAGVMLQAANTGHDGTMTTIHANTPELALTRLANLLRKVEAMPVDVARTEVTSAINVVVQVVRKRERRYVSAISIVHPDSVTTGAAMTETLFVGEFPRDDAAPSFRQVTSLRPDTELAIKMSDAGIDPACWELP